MRKIKLDIVSDVVCPWCYIGFKRLRQAMDSVEDEMSFEIDWHPFELNPDMPPEGEPMDEHIRRKYGSSDQQMQESRARMTAIGEELGIAFRHDRRIYNTFDAHRVLHWAGSQGRQQDLGLALFQAYFGGGRDPSDPALLQELAESLGLDGEEVGRILASDRYAAEVRAEEREYVDAGISAVPAYIVDRAYLLSGAQPPEAFVQALREIAAQPPRGQV